MKYEIKDNLFQAVNAEWLAENKIPDDKSSIGEFTVLHIKNERMMQRLADKLVEQLNKNELSEQTTINFAKFYALTKNFDSREEKNIQPLKPFFDEIINLKDLDELKSKYVEYSLRGYTLPIDYGVTTDFMDSRIQTLHFAIADHILPDKSHYDIPRVKTKFLRTYKSMAKSLLIPYLQDAQKVRNLINLALKYDKLIAKYSLTSLEKVKYTELYKPFKLEKIASKTKNFDFNSVISQSIAKPVDKIIFSDTKFARNIDKLFNENVFEQIKAWLAINLVLKFSKYLDQKTRNTAEKYSLSISGQSKPTNKRKHALQLALSYFSIPIGTILAKKILGPKSKKNIEKMVVHMIDIYKHKLQSNEWLSQATIDKAILKLSTLGVHIGYPNEFKPYYPELKVTSDSIIENVFEFNKVVAKYSLSQYKEPVNKNLWGMAPHIVNAYYNPSMNHIVFPAGILAGAFYSSKQSSAENYGGIGAVIAHEISHAFDNNGANFDENGNLKMWWTESDFAKFKERTKGMINLFQGAKIEHGACNGELTVSENIADAGGLGCALEAAKMEPDYDAQKFFINWAKIWKGKYKPELAARLLEQDPHAPVELRANIQAANREEFAQAFNIKEGDGMYIEPSKRVKIW
ncbi:endopeptidase O [Mycoplasmopsis californica]|uniref:Endopeptidase O n=1 Tax=Mycoplasmopsis californica TaxID=2113 RepID=A0A059XW26_9BACT|nr:M13-type metalloendopeptidase [Mycoplasmopsis californica]AIA29452.1 endopeptidase O [Mycoplasmopsis californica]